MRGYTHTTYTQRLQIEALLNQKIHKQRIADYVGLTLTSIYREIERGKYTRLNGNTWEYFRAYSADIAEQKYQEHLKAKGAPLKIGHDLKLANYIENKIINEHYTPAAVLGEIKAKALPFDTRICTTTLYSYIDKGIFYKLSNKYLPIKSKKRKRKNLKKMKKAPRGTSIERRPRNISRREDFGHWEMDCVCGSTKAALLVLTERCSRKEIIFNMPEQTAKNVVACLDKLEDRFGKLFYKIFKSITVDNGAEFSDFAGMEKSKYGEWKRTAIYYCHAYSAWERGTNERMNREIRRIIPKGSSLSKYSSNDIKRIEEWLNNYPRQVLGYSTPNEVFDRLLESSA